MAVNYINIKVTRDKVKVVDSDYKIHLGENNVTKLLFDLDEEFNSTTNKAIFKNVQSDLLIEEPIINNVCFIPSEILNQLDEKNNSFELRVYGYDIVDESVIRYSPDYTKLFLDPGSYVPGASSPEEITPTQFEQYSKALNDGLNDLDDTLKDFKEKEENGYFKGDSGLVTFEIADGHLIATATTETTLNKYSIKDGHLILEVG